MLSDDLLHQVAVQGQVMAKICSNKKATARVAFLLE
jgi:hypothetical protein